MSTTLIRIYNDLSHAEIARRELLECGIEPSRVELASTEDEAGPAQGNFATGNDESGESAFLRRFGSLVGAEEQTYEHDYRHAVQCGTVLLTIHVGNDEEFELASGIADRSGGIDLDARASSRSGGIA